MTPAARSAMKNRLFHTLVLSSASLLEACATRSTGGADRTAVVTTPSSGGDTTEATTAPSSAAPTSAEPTAAPTESATSPTRADERSARQVEAEASLEAVMSQVRACSEAGWPTTKSAGVYGADVERGARRFRCLTRESASRYPALPRCCEQSAAP